jgi:hypothetical protein
MTSREKIIPIPLEVVKILFHVKKINVDNLLDFVFFFLRFKSILKKNKIFYFFIYFKLIFFYVFRSF